MYHQNMTQEKIIIYFHDTYKSTHDRWILLYKSIMGGSR